MNATANSTVSAPQTITLHGRKVVGGYAEGEALVTNDTISGWGGIDPMTGTVIETRQDTEHQRKAEPSCM